MENGAKGSSEVEVREAKLGDHLTVLLPAPWLSEQMPDGRWWCGSADESESAIIHAAVAAPRQGTPEDATPSEAAKLYLDYFVDVLNSIDGVAEIESKATPTGFLLRSCGRYVEDDATFQEHRWYLFRGIDAGVIVFRIALHLREPVRDVGRRDGLIKLFEDQIQRVHGRPVTADGEEDVAFQDFVMDGVVAIRIPARWSWRQKGEDWYCYDPDGRPGRLWAGYDEFQLKDGNSIAPDEAASSLAREWADAWQPENSRVLHTDVRPAPFGSIAYLIDENIDDAESDPRNPPLRCYRWICFAVRKAKRSVRSWYTLMMPIAQADTPQMRALLKLIDTEIEAQRLLR
jgi:hypothetical protein